MTEYPGVSASEDMVALGGYTSEVEAGHLEGVQKCLATILS